MKQDSGDALWLAILQEAEQAARDEPMLASFLHMTVLRHSTLEDVLAFHLSSKLASPVMDARADGAVPRGAGIDPAISASARADIRACFERDPACDSYSTRCCISRASMRCKASASPTGCGSSSARPWRCSCRTAFPKSPAPTSTRRPVSARG
jgi:hypothetical protein